MHSPILGLTPFGAVCDRGNTFTQLIHELRPLGSLRQFNFYPVKIVRRIARTLRVRILLGDGNIKALAQSSTAFLNLKIVHGMYSPRPGAYPFGRPSAVQIRSLRICRTLWVRISFGAKTKKALPRSGKAFLVGVPKGIRP